MPNIYKLPTGQDVYDYQGQTIEAKTGNPVDFSLRAYNPNAPITQPITSQDITSQPAPALPTPSTDTTNYDSIIAGGQGVIGAFAAAPKEEDDLTKRLDALTASIGAPPPSTEGAYTQAYQEAGVQEAQQRALTAQSAVKSAQAKLAGIQAQIQSVINRRDVQNLQLEKQASGGQVVTTVLNRQQQEINRQAAIEALPLQALALAAQAEVAGLQGESEYAQSTLKMAQDRLDTAFKLKSQDIKNEYDYKKDARTAIYDFLTAEQKRRADAKQKTEDRDFTAQQNNLNNAQSLSIAAMNNGQADIAMKITQLDPKSATFVQDLAELQRQIKPKVTGATPGSREEYIQIYKKEPTEAELNAFTARREAAGRKLVVEKPPTQAQSTVAGYAARLEQAEPTLNTLENDISGMNFLSYEAQIRAPATFQSAKIQQYMQASRNFINANLRRESGAVISPSEFSEARKQYLPQPGDTAETLTQKELNRKLVFQNLKRAAGTAFASVDELLSGISPRAEESEVYTTPDGTEYAKGEDGLYYPK